MQLYAVGLCSRHVLWVWAPWNIPSRRHPQQIPARHTSGDIHSGVQPYNTLKISSTELSARPVDRA